MRVRNADGSIARAACCDPKVLDGLINSARAQLIHLAVRFGPHVAAKAYARLGGATSGEFSMSDHLRSYFPCLVLVGTLSAAPACANPFADLFNNAPREPAATSSAQPECMPRPGNSSGVGQRWVYRRDGHRKCWFLAEGIATVRKPVHGRATNRAASLDD